MNGRSPLLLLMIASMMCASLLTACGDPMEAAAGTYEMDRDAVKAAAKAHIEAEAKDDAAATLGAGMMMAMIDATSMTMILDADGTATMKTNMPGQAESATGTWERSGKSITLTVASEGEKPEPVTGTIDGDTITLRPAEKDEMPFPLVFKKKA